MQDVKDFVRQVLGFWVAIMTSTLAAALYGAWQVWRSDAQSWQVYAVIALSGVVVACFGAWKTAREELVGVRAELAVEIDRHNPRLDAKIEMLATGEAEVFDGKYSATVVAVVAIRNLGAPSIADYWELCVRVDGRECYGLLMRSPSESISLRGNKYGQVTFRGEDSLYQKTIHNPIPQGSQVSGFLIFAMPDLSLAELKSRGAKMLLTYRDVLGRTLVVREDELSEAPPGKFWPGVSAIDNSPSPIVIPSG